MQTPHIRRAPNSALRSGSVTRWLNAAATSAGGGGTSGGTTEKRSGKKRNGGGGKMYGVVKKATQTTTARAVKTERSGLPKCQHGYKLTGKFPTAFLV